VRAPKSLRAAFSLLQKSSMGFMSEEYAGRKIIEAPAWAMSFGINSGLWAPTLSRMTTSPGFSFGTRTCSRNASNTSASVPPSIVINALTLRMSRAPSIVVRVPRLRGTPPGARSPRGALAWSRVIPMSLPASSTKTRRRGSSLFVSPRNLRRHSWIRGVFRSVALKLHVSRQRELPERSPHRGTAYAPVRASMELPGDFLDRQVGLLLHELPHQIVLLGRQARRHAPAHGRSQDRRPGLSLEPLPPVHRRLADLEQLSDVLVDLVAGRAKRLAGDTGPHGTPCGDGDVGGRGRTRDQQSARCRNRRPGTGP